MAHREEALEELEHKMWDEELTAEEPVEETQAKQERKFPHHSFDNFFEEKVTR